MDQEKEMAQQGQSEGQNNAQPTMGGGSSQSPAPGGSGGGKKALWVIVIIVVLAVLVGIFWDREETDTGSQNGEPAETQEAGAQDENTSGGGLDAGVGAEAGADSQ